LGISRSKTGIKGDPSCFHLGKEVNSCGSAGRGQHGAQPEWCTNPESGKKLQTKKRTGLHLNTEKKKLPRDKRRGGGGQRAKTTGVRGSGTAQDSSCAPTIRPDAAQKSLISAVPKTKGGQDEEGVHLAGGKESIDAAPSGEKKMISISRNLE